MFRNLISAALALALCSAASASPSEQFAVERVAMLMRHGVRAPLPTEAGAAALAPPFPTWTTSPGILTEHGAEAVRRLAAYEAVRLRQQNLLAANDCPGAGAIAIWANSAQRTIATAQAWADGLAPSCALAVGHVPEGQRDPLFSAVAVGAVPFDARAAADSINQELGVGLGVATREKRAVMAMEKILGCETRPTSCGLATMAAHVEPTPDGRNIRQVGLVETTSGTAQIFLLQYAEGLPMAEVGWGRATPERIELVSRLHARLFDATDRSQYMAPRIGGGFARRIIDNLSQDQTEPVHLIVGHDGNIAALTALMGVHFTLPGYGADDPPIGGGLLFERVRDTRSGERFVRLFYLAQTPLQVRTLDRLGPDNPPSLKPLAMPFCGNVMLCPLSRFSELLRKNADAVH